MEAVVFFVFFGIYIMIRVLLGGGETRWEKSSRMHQKKLALWLEKGFSTKDYFDQALSKNPTDVFALVSLGNYYLSEDMPEKAMVLAQRAFRLENSVSEVHLLMSKGLYQFGEWTLALQHAKNAVWFGRQHVEAKNWLGKLLLAGGDIEGGIHHLEDAFALALEEERKTKGFLLGTLPGFKERKSNKYK